MPDQLTDRARRAAEEILKYLEFRVDFFDPELAAIIERHMLEYIGNLDYKDRIEAAKYVLTKDVSKQIHRLSELEPILIDAYAKLNEAKLILGKIL